MGIYKEIAAYLISKRVTSSQSMTRWFLPLMKKFGDGLEDAVGGGEYQQYMRILKKSGLISGELSSYLLQYTLWKNEAQEEVARLVEAGIKILLYGDFGYPKEFTEIADSPLILFCYGNCELLTKPEKITLVGTRAPSALGVETARQYAFEASACSVVTVSGYAQGIDTEVFCESQRCNADTIAILPQLMFNKDIGEGTTLFLSEYQPGSLGISKWQFIARNRLLAALGFATVVVEAPIQSGTLITADLAKSYGRSVYVSLPDPREESSLGGRYMSIASTESPLVQSLYDVFYHEEKGQLMQRYKDLVNKLSSGRITIPVKQHKHLAMLNLARILHEYSQGDLGTLDSTVVELHRFGIIKERKNNIVFNFSGYNSWPKT